MTRFFIAIPLPFALRQRLALLRANLPDARWIEPDDFHLTLSFIGDCDGPTLTRIVTELEKIAAEPFQLQLSGTGFFGHNKPRAIWMGVTDDTALLHLHHQINAALRRVDLEPDGRKFIPHVTLARLSRTRPAAVARALEGIGDPWITPFIVDNFALYSSGRSRGGGPYTIDEIFSFAHDLKEPTEH